MSPRQNKAQRDQQQHILNECAFLNISMRDKQNMLKLKVFKVVHAFIHRRVFVFYQRVAQFENISRLLIRSFGFSEAEGGAGLGERIDELVLESES